EKEMDNGVMKLTTFKRMRKRRLEPVCHSKDIVSDLSAFPYACQTGKTTKVSEVTSASERSSPCFFDGFCRGQRSKRRRIPREMTIASDAAVCKDHVMQKHQQQLHLRAHARRRRKSKQVVEVLSDSEETPPHSLHCRGQPKRRGNCSNTITRQQGKLDTNKFTCYLENMWRGFPEEKRHSVTYIDCFWFELYTKDSNKAKVMSWIKKKGIFSKRYVFVPIVKWCHWSLLILCHLGENIQSKTRSPCMLLLDSLQMAEPMRLEPGIRKFVLDIFEAEERTEKKELIRKIPFLVPKVPQQRDGKECGKFVLYYINLFLESAPKNFSLHEGYPYFLKEDWFTPEGLECFCRSLDSMCD
ncbi:hypothetical protein RJ640_030363, partial [Escallonia rubra]